MAEMMIGLGIPASFALVVAMGAGAVLVGRQVAAAVVRRAEHERMMRPQNVYFVGR